jgi:hypothetical protein
MQRLLLLVLIFVLAGCSPREANLEGEDLVVGSPGVQLAREGPKEQEVPVEEAINPSSTPALANLGPAPELANDVWINSAEPLRLANLRGKVVLIEMWTFG